MGRPFSSVLIANRGEIAVRIARACREARLRAVAVYSDADAGALHVREADEAHRIGPPPVRESYLDVEAILAVARASGAEAIHPGYGFLAENADFAERCRQEALVWIGPSPAAMRLLGNKAAAKALAEHLRVPTLPGYHGEAQDDATLRAEAERIGFPVLVKAAAGGGGRGMRLVESAEHLDDSLAAARREARAAFGDDRLLLERYVRRPRHVEIQIFADEHGNVVYLGERDCSIQRRHQKVIEEAPAPHFGEEQRRAMGEAAVALGRAARYTNAGTVEFLLDEEGRFYFLEVNARLQVEHPVTEMVTGLDLVRFQFAVAAGDPLPVRQADVRLAGHAIECRLYAEDPAAGFLPSTGRLERFHIGAPAERVDAGVARGDDVSPFYDPLLAKIIVHAEDRQHALIEMGFALDAADVAGIRTNLDLLRAVVGSPAFERGDVHTGLIEEHDLVREATSIPDDVLIAAAASETYIGPDPDTWFGLDREVGAWQRAGPWRMGWVGAEICYCHSGGRTLVRFMPTLDPSEPWRFDFGERTVDRRIHFSRGTQGEVQVVLDGDDGARWFVVSRFERRRTVLVGRRTMKLEVCSPLGSGRRGAVVGGTGTHDLIRSPMPGRVVRLLVAPGDHVKASQILLVLEAMKIEHLVAAPRDGIVEAVRFKEGDQVDLGAELIELED